jgi:two-component system chemotaxis sensor kinase CheA
MNARHPAQTFLLEADDLLLRIEEIALELNPGDGASDLINQLFRAFHTVKGSGAMFGFDAVAEFTHHVETVLDCVREGHLPVSEELIRLILQSKDRIKTLLDAAQTGADVPETQGAAIVTALNALLPAAGNNASQSARRQPGQRHSRHQLPGNCRHKFIKSSFARPPM